jgi:glycosyltransferase involved in cell wall biosynthesis
MSLAVLIPTFRRNASLERALRSVFAQSRAPDRIVIADNCPDGGAHALVKALQGEAPCPLIYVHAPQPGVANARNAGFEACAGVTRIAQIDDDESASADWLAELEAIAEATGAAVVFGPVEPEAQGAGPVRTAWLRRLYARLPDLPDGTGSGPWGCGNSLIDLTACRLPSPPFDPAANETGGEDDRLFSILEQQAAVFAWAARARVIEHVDPARGAWRALARRAFAFGQGPSQEAAGRKAWIRLALWMGIGAAQAALFALAAAPARLAGPQPCALCIDKAVQGAGKLVWFDRFAPRFYGAALIKPAR